MKDLFLGDSEVVPSKQKIFIPLTINKRFWNKDMPNVFLNKAYEAQIEPEDKDIQYTILQTSYTYAKDERFQTFCSRLINALGEVLNQYHELNESNSFWRAMLWLWVQEYATSMKFKIEQYNNLQKMYPPKQYIYCSCVKKFNNLYQFLLRNNVRYVTDDEEYHFATYTWIADNFFDFCMEKKDVQNEKKEPKKGAPLLFEILRIAFHRFIKIVISILNTIFPSKACIGLYHAECGWLQVMKWYLQSHGEIQEISIPIEREDYKIDDVFRKSLPKILKDKLNASEEEQIVLNFLPYAFPPFFIEKFKKQYNAARDYLHKNNNLVIIFTLTSMLESNVGKICELLLQKRGGKVIGQQHGGTYQVTTSEQEHMRELEWNDMFYYWGKSALTYRIEKFPDCKILYGPSYKFSRGTVDFLRSWTKIAQKSFSKDHTTKNCFLFVGTALEAYPRAYTDGNVDGEKWEYIQRKIRFLSSLSETARRKMIVREFPKDYGWHMKETIEHRFPNLRISFNEGFNDLLDGCSLFISDVLSTPWIEAIYIGKPVIFLLFDHEISIQNYEFRKEEKKYIEMLGEVGVIVHSPEEAAELVNHLTDYGITEWWMDEERQRVIRLVRERWTTEVDDIDDWWYQELLSQAEKVKHGV